MESDKPGGVCGIILAAGANTRLNGIVAPFNKPLVLVNGKPLIRHSIDHLLEWDVTSIIIVASPENVRQLLTVAKSPVPIKWVLQIGPTGVVEAIKLAMMAVDKDRVVIVCADNTFAGFEGPPMSGDWIATRTLPNAEAKRFTRLEHGPRGDMNLCSASSPRGYGGKESTVWIGPVTLGTAEVRNALERTGTVCIDVEDLIMQSTTELQAFTMECQDLGIPESLSRE
jgi:hypothetical protein